MTENNEKKHRVLLFGAAGQLGQAIQYLKAQKKMPESWDLRPFSQAQGSIADSNFVRHSIQSIKPHLLINAAAISSVDYAEQNRELATAVNFYAVTKIAAQCAALDIPVIHLSTDYVFDGSKKEPYTPNDQMNPLNHYADSKMMGEEALRHDLPWHVILRVSSLFSAFRQNLLTKALRLIETKDEIRVVTDILSAPTCALDAAQAIITIGDKILNGKVDGYGTFHYCGSPGASRFDFFDAVMKAYQPYTPRRPKLVPTMRAEMDGKIARPSYSLLDCAKIRDVYGIEQVSWQERLAPALELLHHADRMAHARHSVLMDEPPEEG